MKSVLLFLLVVWVLMATFGAALFDQICVKGRLAEAQVWQINTTAWEKCPKYVEGKCQAEAGDRVVARECSEFLRRVWDPLEKWR